MPIDTRFNPLISVIIPVFNGEIYLRKAIQSVLDQDYKKIQLILVDDGSTDSTSTILERYRDKATIIRQNNSGPGAARNKGIRIATGELIAFLDADDLWPKDNLSQHVAVFAANPNFDVVLGKLQCLRAISPANEVLCKTEEETRNSYLDHQLSVPFYSYLFGAAVAKSHVIQSVGYIDEQHNLGEDVDWFLRVRESKTTLSKADHIALHYRRHETSLTQLNRENSMLRVLKESLDRRRESTGNHCNAKAIPPVVVPVSASVEQL